MMKKSGKRMGQKRGIRMKPIFWGLLMLTLLLNIQTFASENAAFKKTIIEKSDEFIDLDQNTVKFLFKTNIGSQVQIFLGETKNKLVLTKTVENYDFQSGMIIDGLTPGITYYYRIVSRYGSLRKAVSPVGSFVKLDRVTTGVRAEWARTAVFYEIFVRSFADGDGDGSGDFKGLTEKLDYLKELGVTALWLMPCFDSPSYHGNDCSDYNTINPAYGTNAEFLRFLTAAHAQGMKVIIDLAVNHTSAHHPWFIQAQKSPRNPYRPYYVWADAFDDVTAKGPWGETAWRGWRDRFYLALFAADMPDLNFRYAPLREEIKKIAGYWLDPNHDGDPSDGVDGFRVDAAMHIDHTDADVTHAWWQEFNAYVKAINPNAFLVGEVYAGNERVASFLQDMDSCFNFSLANRFVYMSGGRYSDPVASLSKIHQKYFEYSKNYIDSTFITNHDQARIATIVGGDLRLEKLSASLLLTLPGTPFIYYGEELGQQANKPDEYIRGPFDWYAAAQGDGMTLGQAGFLKYTLPDDGISVEEQEKDPRSLLNYYRTLIRIRKENPSFFTGAYRVIPTPEDTYGYLIEEATHRLVVIHNLAAEEKRLAVNPGAMELISATRTGDSATIGPYETVILKY